jgi:hypothetical protein
MTALREAVVLPLLFLTVAGLGGLRIGTAVVLVPPPLISLVLAILLLAALVRAGVFAPQVLMNPGRPAIENVSGFVVLVTLFAAAAQIFTLLTPERGLLHVVFSLCFFVQLASTAAGVRGRVNLLRSLVVLLGSAFVMRYIVLENLYAPNGGMAKRLLTTIVEGASLGTIQYEPSSAATGYVAFLTLVLFVIGLVLLPPASRRAQLSVRALHPPSSAALIVLVVVSAACTACAGSEPPFTSEGDDGSPEVAAAYRARDAALAAARVWSPPETPVSAFDFTANPARGFAPSDDVSCRFTVRKPSGATPKFHCQLPDGRDIKVKYGNRNAELQAELAGTRLLRALGFPADEMFAVRAVHCAGCPAFPFPSLSCRERLGLDLLCLGGAIDYTRVRTFFSVVIERRMDARVVEAFDGQGWAWYELDRIDSLRGGSTRAEVDALRLMAVFLAHWDNKAANQRLICPAGREIGDDGCAAPMAMVQDVGATFGPNRIDLPNWRAAPVWRDRATCTVSMENLPYAGATFPPRRISDAGRLMLARLLEQLSTRQLADLFTASGIVRYDAIDAESRGADGWIKAFRERVAAIRDGRPCPQ